MYPESSNCWPTGKTLSSCLRWKIIFWFKVRGKVCLTEVPNSNIFRYKATQAMGEAGANCGALGSTSKEIPVGYFENSWACLTVSAGWIRPSAFPSARDPIPSLQDPPHTATISIGTSTHQHYLCHLFQWRMSGWIWRVCVCLCISSSATLGKNVNILHYTYTHTCSHTHAHTHMLTHTCSHTHTPFLCETHLHLFI